ncbi:MAG: CotH kinase family protein, partial [Planctomycetes bacterium]|nr:CotH kinase family protein [Planctomycetota bacterium]
MRAWLPLLLSAGVLHAQRAEPGAERPDPAREFFAAGGLVRAELTLAPEDREHLRQQPREYVRATLRIDGGEAWADVGVKLKGSAGSFRKVDDGPGFTVNLGKFGNAARFHGLRRFHLNNGAQDDSRLCEWLGNEVFTAAGYPAPRVSHAHVFLDGVELGLYVLREAFDEQFVQRVFGDAPGNL